MARPKVFVSSTYYDLKHIRASVEAFIDALGFDSVLFEKGDIAFHPDRALDESCYREARKADIFVLVIGGRYGSQSSGTQRQKQTFYTRYDSITRKEFDSAQDADVPTFILIDAAVSSEYQTYIRNKRNRSIKYAHVDSVGVFQLIETILEKSKNNPVFSFERATDITDWLREQWAGLFRDLLADRSNQKQLSTLSSQVLELQSINSTLKTYLEAVLNKTNPDSSARIIADQEELLEKTRQQIRLEQNKFYGYLLTKFAFDDTAAIKFITEQNSADQAVESLDKLMKERDGDDARPSVFRRLRAAQNDFNRARVILERSQLDFTTSSYADVSAVASPKMTDKPLQERGGDSPQPKPVRLGRKPKTQ